MAISYRPHFSTLYEFLRKCNSFRPLPELIKEVEDITFIEADLKASLIAKITQIWQTQNSKIALLSNYKDERAKGALKVYQKDFLLRNTLQFRGASWIVNVVLSTSRLNKVLKPEIVLKLHTDEEREISMTLSVEMFEELRRQIALMLRYMHQAESIKFLK